MLRRVLFQVLEGYGALMPTIRDFLLEALDRAKEDCAQEFIRTKTEQLEQSETHYRTLVENVHDYAIFSLDSEGRIVTWNPGAERITGYAPKEILGKKGAILFTPEDRERGAPEAELQTARQNGKALDERWHQRKDGSRFFASGVVTPIASRAEGGFVKVMRDITDRKRAEQRRTIRFQISRTLGEARTLEEAAPRILEAISRSTGWGYSVLWMEDAVAEVLRPVARYTAPGAEYPRFDQVTQNRALRAGEGLAGTVWASGKPLWLPDVLEAENFPRLAVAREEGLHAAVGLPVLMGERSVGVLEFFCHRIREPDEELLDLLGTLGCQLGQFLERRRTEAALAESEARKSAILEAALDAIITIDGEDRIVEFNPAAERIFGYSRSEMIGERMGDRIVPSRLREAQLQGMARYLETGVGPGLEKRLELPAMRKDGTEFPAEIGIVRTRTEGSPLFTAYLRDITERKQLEESLLLRTEQLLEADRRKDEFLATLAHELRNPLAPIRTATAVMRLRGGDEPVLQRARETVERQVAQMSRLIEDLMDVARITRGQIELRKEVVDLSTVVSHAVQTARPLTDAREQHLSVSVPLEPVRLEGDPTRLEQVITNLLTNASKFTPPRGQIWVTAECERGQAVIRVRDTGKGIPPEMLPRIWDLFAQVNPSIDRAEGGLGLGLTLVRTLTAMHGGTVEAHSAGPGQGSEFVIRLPSLLPRVAATTPQAEVDHDSGNRSLRVLIVDDNVDAADTLADLIQLWGHGVRIAHDGPTALERAPEFRPEVVLLDIGLPGMDGFEVARRLREMPELRGSLLVAITGFGQPEDRRRTEQAGFARHLVKPMNPQELQSLLADFARGQSAGETGQS